MHSDGSLGVAWDIPTHEIRGKNVVNEDRLVDDIRKLAEFGITSLTMEAPFWMPADRTGQAGKFTISHQSQMVARINSGVLYGMLKMVHKDIRLVQPIVWHRAVGLPKGATKADSIKMAASLWPQQSAKLAKDGRADAALMAYYGYRHAKYAALNLDQGATNAKASMENIAASLNRAVRHRR